MSSSSITDPRMLFAAVEKRSLRDAVMNPIKQLAFWSAIVLPFLYLPLLATGLESQSILLAFIVLVALNVCALLVGQRYDAGYTGRRNE